MNCSHGNMQCIQLCFLWERNFFHENLSQLVNLIGDVKFGNSHQCR